MGLGLGHVVCYCAGVGKYSLETLLESLLASRLLRHSASCLSQLVDWTVCITVVGQSIVIINSPSNHQSEMKSHLCTVQESMIPYYTKCKTKQACSATRSGQPTIRNADVSGI